MGGRLENSEFKSQIKIADKNPLLRGISYIPRKNLQIGLQKRGERNKAHKANDESSRLMEWLNDGMIHVDVIGLKLCFN